ncbi:MAG: tetratricopeptide repeat protein [Candidatus Scalindua sp.]|jgi:cytochrome c-type biogenesis protein CcmH/NrfG|nr:tetratricopeptide repeat protein [Candidatus Scalindua sp.]MBT6564802.1 tetratricopeptide repeat protein [Candidatus Scalindua sp.]MBT7213487.1 tetratricopeptide repeat protein [Candidatus Scalindua sp.]
MIKRYLTIALISWIAFIGLSCQWGRLQAETTLTENDASQGQAVTESTFTTLMNLGKAYLENRDVENATAVYEKTLKIHSASPEALRNLARALRLGSKNNRAIETLLQAKKLETGSVATNYLLGLSYADTKEDKKALVKFEEAVRLDPFTAVLRYQLALAYERTGKLDSAARQLYETVRLDPFHVNAHYKLSQYARKKRDKKETMRLVLEVKRLLKIFDNKSETGSKSLVQCIYTIPELPRIANGKVAVSSQGIDISFSNATDTVFPDKRQREALLATVLDQDDSGRYTLFTVGEGGSINVVKISAEGRFTTKPLSLKLPSTNGLLMAISGNFYDPIPIGDRYDAKIHSLNDLFLCGTEKSYLLLRTGKNSFEDVTIDSGLGNVKGRHAQWIDYDHDGDIDLLIAGMERLELWQNNGDLTFTNVTAETGISNEIPPVMVGVADLDSNNAVDVVVTQHSGGTLVFENQQFGKFEQMSSPPGPWPNASGIELDDLNNDGHPDSMLMTDHQIIILFGQSTHRQNIPFSMIRPSGVVTVDYDNDGFQDILVFGNKSNKISNGLMQLWRNTEMGTDWNDATDKTGLDHIKLPPIDNVLVADLDNDHDSDLLIITSDHRLHFLRNDGGHRNGQLQIRLQGTKSNTGGIGTRVEIREGAFLATRTISRVPVEIGLGGRKSLDVIQVLWTNGVVDNQINQEASVNLPIFIKEPHVDTGSCPFLYAWDGNGYRFVTDLLGNAPVGLPLTRDKFLPADTDEYVVIGNSTSIKPLNSFYTFEVTSEFNEVLYFDASRLVVVDHDQDVEIHTTDKIKPAPFAPSELWALNSRLPLIDALGSNGENYKDELTDIDGSFTLPGILLPPQYRGVCNSISIILDFGRLDDTEPLVLALTGWLQYGQASTNIALSQNDSVSVIPPMLEAEMNNGDWKKLDVIVGMPAGKTKTILVDLHSKLPVNTRRLRLTTTFEIRWDRIALFRRSSLPEVTELSPVNADLRWRGFSEIKTRKPGNPKTPLYIKTSEQPPWLTSLQGWCTAYGNVIELAEQEDDAVVVMNGGDALNLKFNADAISPVPQGKNRTFLFYSVGWNKDGDYNIDDGHRVYPIANPTTNRIGNGIDEWQLKYNTRWVDFNRFSQILR